MNTLKRTLLIIGGSLALLSAVLVIHIRMVTKDGPKGHLANMQLARIDFQDALNTEEAAHVRNTVNAMPGVMHARVNAERTNLVYAYERGKQDQDAVVAVVDGLTETPSQKLVVSAAEAASGCPAMEKDGVQDRLGRWIAGIVH